MLASTTSLNPGALLRLTLEEHAWFTSAASLSRTMYESMGETLPVSQVAQPTTAKDGIWLQDVRVHSGAGVLVVSGLVAQLEDGFPVKVRDIKSIGPGDIAGTAAAADRERELQHAQDDKAKESKLPAWLQKAVNAFRTVRAMFVFALVIGILWFAWPWIWPALKSLRARKGK